MAQAVVAAEEPMAAAFFLLLEDLPGAVGLVAFLTQEVAGIMAQSALSGPVHPANFHQHEQQTNKEFYVD
jgi:hypothetical protein